MRTVEICRVSYNRNTFALCDGLADLQFLHCWIPTNGVGAFLLYHICIVVWRVY